MNSADRMAMPPWRRAIGGAVLLLAGITILGISWSYPTGNLSQMGPGYIPKVVGIGLMVMALLVIVTDLRDPAPEREEPLHWRALLFISAAVVIFGLLVNWAGLVPATFCAIVVAMLADGQSKLRGVLIYSTIVTFFSWLLFIPGLGLPISAFWR